MTPVWMLLACALLMLGLAVMAWALFWDRARGRRRCPSCQYDMAGVVGLRCPECGQKQRSEREFHRTHRRWRAAGVGLLLVVSSFIGGTEMAQHIKWAPHLPTWVLVRIVDPVALANAWQRDPVASELHDRMTKTPLTESQSQVLIDRVLALDPEEAAHLLRTRTRWPAGAPVWVSGQGDLGVLRYAYAIEPKRVRVRLHSPADGKPRSWIEIPESGSAVRLGVPVPGTGSISVETELYYGSARLWHGIRAIETDVSGAPDEVLAPVSDQKLDAAVAVWMEPPFFEVLPKRSIGVWLWCDRRDRVFSRYVALGLRLRLYYQGVLVATGSVTFPPRFSEIEAPSFSQVYEYALLDCVGAVPSGYSNKGWELEVTGDQDMALLDYDQFGRANSPPLRQTLRIIAGVPAPASSWKEPTEYWSGSFRTRAYPGEPASLDSKILDAHPDVPSR